MTDPRDYAEKTTDGGAPSRLPERFRFPSRYGSWLVIGLAVVAGAVGAVAAAFAVVAFVRAGNVAENARQAAIDTFDTRRRNVEELCFEREIDRAETRQAIRALGLSIEDFPVSPSTGEAIFAPIQGGRREGCRQKSLELVPESNRPGGKERSHTVKEPDS